MADSPKSHDPDAELEKLLHALEEANQLEEDLGSAEDEQPSEPTEDITEEDLFGERESSFGHISVEDHGLTLNLGESHEENPEVITREITDEDRMDLAEVQQAVAARAPHDEIDPSLDRVTALLDILGSPQDSFTGVHVAGTNGKTSTARMIESLVGALHRRTGRFTSPALQNLTDTISIDNAAIHPADLVEIYREIAPLAQMVDGSQELPLSAFEMEVALAFAAFADAPVDIGVVEVGMGGTWDATNVFDADVCVITPVALDHQDYLGQSLEEIAAQKAGIIPADGNAVVIIAEQHPEAMQVILEAAVEADVQVARAGLEFGVEDSTVAVGGQMLTLRGLGGTYEEVFLPLSGEHQAHNAAVALAAVEALFGVAPGRGLDIEAVRAGFAQVSTPGRLERVRSTPTTFLDAAHNPAGAKALARALDRDFEFSRLVGVMGVLEGKDAAGILEALEPQLAEVVITEPQSSRALPAEELEEYAISIFGEERVHVVSDLPGAYSLAVELAEDADIQSGSGVIITGSVVLAGQARTMFGLSP